MSIKKKSILWIFIGIVVTIAIVFFGKEEIAGPKAYTVKRKTFESVISGKGDIEGKNSVMINLPDEMKHRDLRIHDFDIKELIQEGTQVKKGDWVATLDIASITSEIQTNKDELDEMLAEFNNAKIDTAIQLTSLREEIKEFGFDLEYKKLELEQARFESPAYQRKTQVAYNKTQRQLEKKKRDYELRKLDLKVRTKRVEDRYNYYVMRDSLLKKAAEAARITAPQAGMVMYPRLWGGRKIRVGDEVSPWEPAIISIPDLSQLVSETYIEEIHITKIQEGDSVWITVDALPEKVFPGTIAEIANIGRELSGYESKVFKVVIDIKGTDPELKPGMSSNNNIVINQLPDVIAIPRECLFAEDQEAFVYIRKSGRLWKKKVTPGIENDAEVVIESGLDENDKVLLEEPEKSEEIVFFEDNPEAQKRAQLQP